jgi:hypothetical protein
MKCPKCGGENPTGTKECKHCGIIIEKYKASDNHANNSPPSSSSSQKKHTKHTESTYTSDRTFFDFEFNRFATPMLIKIAYAFIVLVGGLGAALLCVTAITKGQIGRAALAIFSYAVGLVLFRLYAEFMIILFKIEENTRKP